MPARTLSPDELKRCLVAIATRYPERPALAPGADDYDVLDSERYCRVFIRELPSARIVAGTQYLTYVVNLAATGAHVVGQFLSRRREDGEDETVAP
jgi:hypothetical protein